MREIHIYTDGGSRGNPGPAAIAVLIYDNQGKLLKSHSEYIGTATNNVAEYRAVLKALKLAEKLRTGQVVCTLDSQLVASQLAGRYKIKKPHLRELSGLVKEAEKKFESVGYMHVKRSDRRIRLADRLLNEILDKVGR